MDVYLMPNPRAVQFRKLSEGTDLQLGVLTNKKDREHIKKHKMPS
jgi:hypothetical protein